MQAASLSNTAQAPHTAAAFLEHRYEVAFVPRFLPVSWLDWLFSAFVFYSWLFFWAIVLVGGMALTLGLMIELPGEGTGLAEIGRFAMDAFEELWAIALVLILGYWIARWAKSVILVELGPQGLRLRRRIGTPVELAWTDVRMIERRTFAPNSLSILQNYRIVDARRTRYFAPADAVAFQSAISRLRPVTPPPPPAPLARRIGRWALVLASPVLLAVCLAPPFVLLTGSIKYMYESAADGSKYLSGALMRAFLLKPSANEPDAQRALLVNGAKAGDAYVVRKSLERIGSIREMNFENPIVETAVRGRISLSDKPKGADPKATPMAQSEEEERAHTIRILVANGAHIDPGALRAAALQGRQRLFSALVEAGAPLDDVDEGGVPDVAVAARTSSTALLLYLNAKANPNQPDDYGWTPLLHAAVDGRSDSIELLIKHGAMVSTRTNEGGTPLIAVLESITLKPEQKRDIVRLLISKGAVLDTLTHAGYTVAHALARNGDVELLEEFVERAGGYGTRARDGEGLLHSAARRANNVQMIKHLLGKGLGVAAASQAGVTPLHVASGKAVVDFLVNSGADVNARNTRGWTPLHNKVLTGDWDTARALIAHGADKDITDRDGKTPLDVYYADLAERAGRQLPGRKAPAPAQSIVKLLTP
jgi:ankyrin repeat protein